MNTNTNVLNSAARPGLAERLVRSRLRALQHGVLTLEGETYGKRTARCGLEACVRVHDARFYSEVAYGGSVGAGEAYMLGYWSADDLTAAMRILLQNRAVLDGMETGLAALSAPLRKAAHWAARNTRGRVRRKRPFRSNSSRRQKTRSYSSRESTPPYRVSTFRIRTTRSPSCRGSVG